MKTSLWLGPKQGLEYVFLLPNPPQLRLSECDDQLSAPNVAEIIADNGNHWRKIFTIMAKLVVPEGQDWRSYRDAQLFSKSALVFQLVDVEPMLDKSCVVFIVGQSFRQALPISEQALVLGEKQQAYWSADNTLWCPYLDYRQFPNSLIAEIRQKLITG